MTIDGCDWLSIRVDPCVTHRIPAFGQLFTPLLQLWCLRANSDWSPLTCGCRVRWLSFPLDPDKLRQHRVFALNPLLCPHSFSKPLEQMPPGPPLAMLGAIKALFKEFTPISAGLRPIFTGTKLIYITMAQGQVRSSVDLVLNSPIHQFHHRCSCFTWSCR